MLYIHILQKMGTFSEIYLIQTSATTKSTGWTIPLFVASVHSLIAARLPKQAAHFASAEPTVLFPLSTVTRRNCAGGFFAGHRLIRCKIFLRDSEEHRRDK